MISRLGSNRGPAVRALQAQLTACGYHPGAIDGVFGPRTEAALIQYQRDHGLPVSGAVCVATAESIGLESADAPSVPVWAHTTRTFFADPEEWVGRAQALGLSGLIVTVEDILDDDRTTLRKWRATPGQLAEAAAMLRDAGLGVGALAYPEPGRGRDDAALCAALEPDVCCIDLEENWRGKVPDWDAAEVQVVQEFRNAMPQARVGITSITYRGDDHRLDDAIAASDFMHPQAMATSKGHVGQKRKWKSIAPGKAQHVAMREWGHHEKPHWMVLAAYSQSGVPGHTVASSMRTSYDAAVASGPEAISYWALKGLWRYREHLPW